MKKLAILFAATAMALPTSGMAATIFIGAPGAVPNVFPFGFGFGRNSNYQQVYSNKQFSGPFTISSVSFRSTPLIGTTPAGGSFALSVSTTNAAVDALSTIFSSNLGADNRQVFLGTLAPNFNGTDLTFNFSTPYTYNPGKGNLLLSFVISNFSAGSIAFNSNSGNAGGIFSRVHDFGGGFAGFGLQTSFNGNFGAAVPEPASWAMMIGGFGLVGGVMRRRRRVKVTYA